jgi:hypothetical protein
LMFRQSFPLHLRNPIRDGGVDSHLYTACLMPYLCVDWPSSHCTTSIPDSCWPLQCDHPITRSLRPCSFPWLRVCIQNSRSISKHTRFDLYCALYKF